MTKKTKQWRVLIYVDLGRIGPQARNHKRRFTGYVCRQCAIDKLRFVEKQPVVLQYP